MIDFRPIDPAQIDWSGARLARKRSCVHARRATREEAVASEMRDGFHETDNAAKPGDYIVENPGGERYVVERAEFEKRYRPTGQANVYEPVSAPVRVLELDENVRFEAPWGEEMRIRAGGVLVVDDCGAVYGIQRDEFLETYEYLE
jgi:hypothetical protein